MIADLLCIFTKIISGLSTRWLGCKPENKQRVYFANHGSHFDFLILWASLPKEIRSRVRPVAAKDYWGEGKIQRYFSKNVINAVLVERKKKIAHDDPENPINQMLTALRNNYSLIIFPEGKRYEEDKLHEFKSGLYHLIKNYPDAEYVPVYLENLSRILPKGEFLPIPILGSATFGKPISLKEKEPKEKFLERAKQSIERLKNYELNH